MWADHSVLERRGRSPGRGGLVHLEAAEGDVSYTCLRGEETTPPDIDVDLLRIGIQSLEIGIYDRIAAILLGIPLIDGPFRLPGGFEHLSLDAILQRVGLIELAAVEIYCTRMLGRWREIPVASYECRIGIVVTEEFVVHAAYPDIALERLPVLDNLCTGDLGSERLRAAVCDARILGARVFGIYILPIDARCHEHLVTGKGDLCSIIDMLERIID